MRTVRAIIAAGIFCAMLLGTPGGLASAAVVFPQAGALLNGEPAVERIGCKLQGASLVCDGNILPNRLKRPRLKSKQQPKTSAPSAAKSKSGKSQTAKTPSTKKPASKAVSSKPQAPNDETPGPEQEIEEDESEAASVPAEEKSDPNSADTPKAEVKGPVQHSCPPGNVVLEKPNAAGSHCEPLAKATATPPAAPAAAAPSTPEAKPAGSAASTSPLPETPAAVVPSTPEKPAGSAAPASPPPSAAAVSTPKVEICCSAPAVEKSSGLPLRDGGKFSICGPTEQDAKSMIPTVADLKNYVIAGDITCAPK